MDMNSTKSSGPSTTATGMSSVLTLTQDGGMELENLSKSTIQKKFWENRILFSIIESFVTSDKPLPGLSQNALEYLEDILIDVRLRQLHRRDDVLADDTVNSGKFGLGNNKSLLSDGSSQHIRTPIYELSQKTKTSLSMHMLVEIKALAQSVAKVCAEKLKSNGSQATDLENVLQDIVELAAKRSEQLLLDQAEIERLVETRDKEFAKYEKELEQLNNLIVDSTCSKLHKEIPLIDAAYFKYLKMETESIVTKTEMARRNQLMDESTPGLVLELCETFDDLDSLVIDLEKEISDVNDLEKRFNSLSPEFQQLMRDWDELEENIKEKEWALKELEKYSDTSFNSSFE